MEPVVTTRLVRWGLFVVVILALSWVAAGLRPFTQPMNAAVAVPALIVVGLSWRWSDLGKGARRSASGPRRGSPCGSTLLVLLTAWELAAYVSSPRDAHPTLSSISDSLMSVHVGRAAAFLGWLVVGWALFLRPRRAP